MTLLPAKEVGLRDGVVLVLESVLVLSLTTLVHGLRIEMKGKDDDPTTDGRLIQSLSGLWRHFSSEGYEPSIKLDLRPWIVVFHSPANGQPETWLVCTSAACPSDIYGMACSVLPDTITLEGFGTVNFIDYMIFQA